MIEILCLKKADRREDASEARATVRYHMCLLRCARRLRERAYCVKTTGTCFSVSRCGSKRSFFYNAGNLAFPDGFSGLIFPDFDKESPLRHGLYHAKPEGSRCRGLNSTIFRSDTALVPNATWLSSSIRIPSIFPCRSRLYRPDRPPDALPEPFHRSGWMNAPQPPWRGPQRPLQRFLPASWRLASMWRSRTCVGSPASPWL